MRKILAFILLIPLFFISLGHAGHEVSVYAVVWNINKVPKITYVDPDFNPVLFGVWEMWSFVFSASDEENEKLYYTITTDDWAVSPMNWTINWSWTVNFLYLSPSVAPGSWFTKIYITLNDGANFTVKEVNLYIY